MDAAGTDILSAVTDGVVELALVGAGRMGRMHLRALDPAAGRTAAVRVTDVVEPIKAARDALRGRGYRLHATLADLLAARRPDGVLVAAPTDRHADVARAALAAGIPVLCEKPAGLTWQEVEETGCVAADRGVAFQVAYWRRFVPAMVVLRERVLAGDLGQLVGISTDPVAKQAKFSDTQRFNYPLLSDADGKVATQFGVKRGLLGRLMPVKRTTFVIDTDRTVLDVISSEFSMDMHADKALEVLRQRQSA